ncbi:YjdF family protein [Streptococcus saliviloxodontae]|uniref:Ribosomal protein L24 n=1 Tax=Streptococcus saliviloxodontae TaxID=1349416 RepID=A0ABS2PM16_9STRE|nr:YjdF family protein [Streptococcus saliviloxodontae]MBM7636332.1 ribosomal protein L24 [Streptococcus saliviloxodontae]
MKLTVFFENAFWYGLIEYMDNNHYKVIKHLFGSEPKDFEIFEFIYEKLPRLIDENNKIVVSSSAIKSVPKDKKINPKRMQREINKAKNKPVVSTKAQMELSKVHELIKKEKRAHRKKYKEEMKERQFQLKKEKRMEKRKGH